jgi:hypothetical protein
LELWDFETLELWDFETLKLWNFLTLEFYNFGTLKLWNFWNFGTLELWNLTINMLQNATDSTRVLRYMRKLDPPGSSDLLFVNRFQPVWTS